MKNTALKIAKDTHGRVAPPLILWFLGVPGGLCVLLWFFFFRG